MSKSFKELDELGKILTPSQKPAFKKAKEAISDYLDDEGFDSDDPEYEHTINAGIGEINWSANNLQLISIMEAIEEKIKFKSPLEIETAIKRC